MCSVRIRFPFTGTSGISCLLTKTQELFGFEFFTFSSINHYYYYYHMRFFCLGWLVQYKVFFFISALLCQIGNISSSNMYNYNRWKRGQMCKREKKNEWKIEEIGWWLKYTHSSKNITSIQKITKNALIASQKTRNQTIRNCTKMLIGRKSSIDWRWSHVQFVLFYWLSPCKEKLFLIGCAR